MPLAAQHQAAIKAALDDVVKSGVPGVIFDAIDRNGNYLASTAVGNDAINPAIAKAMTQDSVFWLASCTKLITSIAVMQLVEQGLIALDSADDLYRVLPELQSKEVLVAPGTYEPRQADITLRMLMTHTAGFGYSFFNPRLAAAGLPRGWDEFSGDAHDITGQPLVNQPGARHEYGVSMDWAGIAVSRLSGLTLHDYCARHIFEPLGVHNMSFFPTQRMKDNLVKCSAPGPGGALEDIDHPFRRAVALAGTPQESQLFQSGGAGCFATTRDFCQVMAVLLNDGTSPATGRQLLRPDTVEAMFANHLPQFPDIGRQGTPVGKSYWTTGVEVAYPQGDEPQGWGLSFFLTLSPAATGRAGGTAHWSGIVNLHWWIDRATGVAGIIAAQTLPFASVPLFFSWIKAEKAVYDGLASAQS